MADLRLGSLCTGAGMLDLAAATALGEVKHLWHAETDPDASTVLSRHWPGVPNLHDLTTVDWSDVPTVDVLTSGFPCQPWSMAGKRGGSADERDLWPVRKLDDHGQPRRGVVDAIRELRPPLVLLENVPGLLTRESGQPFGVILTDLDGLGYTVAWTVLGACKVGACHHRHRLFVVAALHSTPKPPGHPHGYRSDHGWVRPGATLFGDLPLGGWPQAGTMRAGTIWANPADPCGSTGLLLPTPTARIADKRGTPSAELAAQRIFAEGRRNLEDAVALMPTVRATDTNGAGQHGEGGLDLRTAVSMFPTPTARDADRGAGRAFAEGRPLSEVVALLPTPLASDCEGGPGRRNNRGEPKLPGAVALMPTPRASDAEKGGPNQRGSAGDVMLPAAVQPGRFGDYEAAVQRHAAAFGTPAPDPTEPGRLGRPRLAAPFAEWMMGCSAGWMTAHVGRRAAIRIAGNGAVRQAAAVAYQRLRAQLAEHTPAGVAR